MLSITLITGLIVFIYAVLCLLYKNQENQSSASDVEVENKIQMLELMNKAKQNAMENIKNTREKFSSLSGPLTNDEAMSYLADLNFLNYWLNNNSGNQGLMGQINGLVQNANDSRNAKKKVLVDILTNMYSMAYIDFLNHQNAEAYNIYAK